MSAANSASFTSDKQQQAAGLLHDLWSRKDRCAALPDDQRPMDRQQGYAVSHGERVLGVAAVSAPIRGLDDEGHYCLSVAGPMVRMQSREREFTRLVVQAASEISWLYGGNAPP